jgi:hypothetical protein
MRFTAVVPCPMTASEIAWTTRVSRCPLTRLLTLEHATALAVPNGDDCCFFV